ncbi:MAG TPA: glutamine synthetase family protein [Streptosporangiaceae bacterium]
MTGAAFDPAATRLLLGTIVDNAGITRAKSVPGHRIAAAAAAGIGLSPVFAVMCVDDHLTRAGRYGGPVGDMRLVPDLSAAAVVDEPAGLAWAPFDQYDQDLTLMETCQRGVLRRQEAAAAAAGLDYLLAFEVEFTVFADAARSVPAHTGPGYGLRPWLALEEFSGDLLDALAAAGVDVETLHPEYGPGQLEVSMAPRPPVAAVDQYVLARLVIIRTARQHGLAVSFAPLTIPGSIGNGCHVHFSAARDGQNVFAGGDGRHGMTADGEALIGGLVRQLPEAAGLFTPSVISHARLVPGMWSGAYACWGLENREAAVRFITGTAGSRAQTANVEVKCIDGASNPYLAAAAITGLSLAGLRAGLAAPLPAESDPAEMPAADREAAGIARLPDSLPAALDLLASSKALRDVLGGAVVDCLVAVRRYEIERYGELPAEEQIEFLVTRY